MPDLIKRSEAVAALEAAHEECIGEHSDVFASVLEARINALPAASDGWRDIETDPPAPNEAVLLTWFHGHWMVWEYEARAYQTGERIGSYSNVSRHGQATHWQPLPKAPETAHG